MTDMVSFTDLLGSLLRLICTFSAFVLMLLIIYRSRFDGVKGHEKTQLLLTVAILLIVAQS